MRSLLSALLLCSLGTFLYAQEYRLFNGSDITGWEKAGEFDVRIGNQELILINTGQDAGWLFTEDTFDNFRLTMEFFVPPSVKSGIAIRYNDHQEGEPKVNGYVINLDHNPDQQNPTGSIFNVARARWIDTLDTEIWNKMEIQALGDHISIEINGELVSEVHSRRSFHGKIGLQSGSSGNAQFRNIGIERLPATKHLGPQIEDYMRSMEKRPMKALFDGSTLSGWTATGEGEWTVEEGVIHGQAGEVSGWLVSQNTYHNFYLKLKFKIDKEENSGVFVRNDPNVEEIGLETGLECNIYDHNGYSHAYSTGSIVTHSRAWSNMVDYGEWNLMEIFAFEDQLCIYVNGRKSTEAHLSENWNRAGTICLQAGTRVFTDNGPSGILFKDIYIKDLEGIPFLGY